MNQEVTSKGSRVMQVIESIKNVKGQKLNMSVIGNYSLQRGFMSKCDNRLNIMVERDAKRRNYTKEKSRTDTEREIQKYHTSMSLCTIA